MGVVAAYPKTLYFQGLSGFFFINHFFATAGAAVVFELYHNSDELKRDGLISESFEIEYASLSFDSFAEDLLKIYASRYDVRNLLSSMK